MEVILPHVRLSMSQNLWVPGKPPTAAEDQAPKYGCHGIFAKGSPAYNEAMRAFMAVATEALKGNAMNVIKSLGKDKKCVRDGDTYIDKTGSIRGGYAGMFYIAARNKMKCPIVNSIRRKDPVTGVLGPWHIEEGDGIIYAGCYVNLKVDIYYQNLPGQGHQINATLKAVQFAEDGEAFGASAGNTEGFDFADPDAGTGETADPFGGPTATVAEDPFA